MRQRCRGVAYVGRPQVGIQLLASLSVFQAERQVDCVEPPLLLGLKHDGSWA